MITSFGAVASVAYGASANAELFSVRANGGLNVRSGPGTSHSVLGTLPAGTRIDSTGPSQNGWAPIDYQGRQGWVSDTYLRSAATSSGSGSSSPSTTRGTAYTTATLNVRTGAGLDYRVLTVLDRGTKVETTGVTSNGYSQIVHGDSHRWVSTQYLSPTAPSSAPSPQPSDSVTKPVSTLPKTIDTKYATTALTLRSTPDAQFVDYGDAPAGASLQVTGRVVNGRAEIVWNGTVRWVTAQYLTDTPPTNKGSGSGTTNAISNTGGSKFNLPGLTANSRNLLAQVEREFPEVKTIYGVRPDSLPDHPSGRALDMMVYSDAALGNRIADWARANAGSLNIEYIIWNQRIWSVARSGEGWRSMADRGSVTANHRDHVHITVR